MAKSNPPNDNAVQVLKAKVKVTLDKIDQIVSMEIINSGPVKPWSSIDLEIKKLRQELGL